MSKEDTSSPTEETISAPSQDAAPMNSSCTTNPAQTTEQVNESANSTDPLAPLLKQIETLQIEVQARKEEVLRVRAEMDNFRKRVQRDKDELRKTAAADLIEELIPILDNLQLGLSSAEKHPEARVVTDGFKMVYALLQSTLANKGLKEINPLNTRFNPNFHECVSQQISDAHEAEHVLQVIRSGYTLGERLLRPATVIISSGKTAPAHPAQPQDETILNGGI